MNPKADELDDTDVMKVFSPDFKKFYVKLILSNLTGSCLNFARFKPIAKKYMDLLDNGARIGYAFNESEQRLGSLPFSDWSVEAKLSNDKKNWILNGVKNKILDDNYDHYLVFARTTDYPEDELSSYKRKYEEPYDGVVCLLVDKKDLKISSDEVNNLDDKDFKYQKIDFTHQAIPRENELFEAEEYGCAALSCRGIGILLATSFQIGVLKALQSQIYKFLIDHKCEFLEGKAVQGVLTQLTEIIYTIEAMNYLVAAMYDSFDLKKFPDMTLETSILKSFTVDQSREYLVKLQTLLGSKLIDVSKFHSIVNLYDSLFDSSLHHRLFVGSMGAHYTGVYKVNDVIKSDIPLVYPTFMLWRKWTLRRNELDNPILDNDVSGHLHVKLIDEGDKLDYCLKRLEYGSYLIIERFKKVKNLKYLSLDINLFHFCFVFRYRTLMMSKCIC